MLNTNDSSNPGQHLGFGERRIRILFKNLSMHNGYQRIPQCRSVCTTTRGSYRVDKAALILHPTLGKLKSEIDNNVIRVIVVRSNSRSMASRNGRMESGAL